MAPTSGRKGAVEAPPPPPVDPRCKQAPDVPPNAVGAFTLTGQRITTPSGAFFQHQLQSTPSQTSFPTSGASRSSRFLADGSLLLSQKNQQQTAAPTKERLQDRAVEAPAAAPIHKKAAPVLSSFVNEKTCFEEASKFVANAHSLNATSTFEQVNIAKDSKSMITFSEDAKEILKTKGVATLVPAMMRKNTFAQATTCKDFPRFTAVLENPNKKRSPLQRAACFVSALQQLQRFVDDNDNNNNNSIPTAGKFSFENKMKENISGVSSTFRHGVVPSFVQSSSSSKKQDPPHYVSTFVDGPRSVIFYSRGFFWKIPASTFSLMMLADEKNETQNSFARQLDKTLNGFDFENARKNDVDLSELTRCKSLDQCESVVNLVGGVCASNMQCIRESFSECQISLSFVPSTEDVSSPNNTGVFSFAPFGLSVNENDGTITITVSCSFINDSCAAALVQWVARVADYELSLSEASSTQQPRRRSPLSSSQRQQQEGEESGASNLDTAALAEDDDDVDQDPTLVEIVRIKASALVSKEDQQGTNSSPNTPSRQGRRGSTPMTSTRAMTLTSAAHQQTHNKRPTSSGGNHHHGDHHQNKLPTNENGILERVTIPVPPPNLPLPELLTIWVPRTIQIPSFSLVDQLQQQTATEGESSSSSSSGSSTHEFEIPRLSDPRSLYFAAALALWDETSPLPPDVLLETRSRNGGCEPLLYLLRSLDIDRFLQAARSAGQPSLGPLPHDLALLSKKAKDSLEQIRNTKLNPPILSVLAAMSSLKMIEIPEQDETSLISRFGNPTIVINETEQEIVGSTSEPQVNYLRPGKFVYHSTSGPLPGLFAQDDRKACFSLQVTRVTPNPKKQNSSNSSRSSFESEPSVKCIFSSPYDFEGAQTICRAISGFAAVIDRYQL